MSPLSDARKRANQKYNSKAYETILVRVKRGQKEIIRARATQRGESLNNYIVTAISNRMTEEA